MLDDPALVNRPPAKGKWNPFEDPTPFSQMTEDHIFDAEFDAIRQRGSQTSEWIESEKKIERETNDHVVMS